MQAFCGQCMRRASRNALVTLVAMLTVAAAFPAEGADSSESGWGQLSIVEGCIGPSLDYDNAYVNASILAVRETYWGPWGLEMSLYEFLRPGGATQRDKHSFLPVYLHFAPWVWRTKMPGREGGTRTAVLCAFAGGSAWAYRSDNPEPRGDDEPGQGPDWGHQYARAGVRYIRHSGSGSLGIECGVVLSPPDVGSSVDPLSAYVALHVSVSFVQ